MNKLLELLNTNLKKRSRSVAKTQLEGILKNTIGNINGNTNLFRIMSFEDLLKSIKEKKFTLVKATEWAKNDLFEYHLQNISANDKYNNKIEFLLLSQQLYGSCFSVKEECIKLWNMFGKNDKNTPYVKIKTTLLKFMNFFYDETQEFHDLKFFSGEICYVTDTSIKKISKKISNIFANSCNDENSANMDLAFVHVFPLLMKSESFEYEQEVRFILNKRNSFNDQFYYFNIEPNNLFEEVVFSPWIQDEDFKKYKKHLINLGYTGIIKKSNLTNL